MEWKYKMAKKKRLSILNCKHIPWLTVKQLHVFILSRTRSLSIMIMDVYYLLVLACNM